MFQTEQFFLVSGLIGFISVLGCGPFLPGQVPAMSFHVTGFTLPAEMAYSTDPAVQTAITSISRNMEAAMRVVTDLIMNGVNDVLQEQGRSLLLPDPLISVILQQLNVTIEYTPLNCLTATIDPMNQGPPVAMLNGCIIINDVVVGLCTMAGGNAMCNLMNMIMNVRPTPIQHRTITGSLRTTNALMATWSKQMWQSVLNRVLQRIVTGRFGRFFSSAIVTVNS